MEQPVTANFLIGGGHMGKLVRDYDWSATTLGPLADWPQSLRTTTGLVLCSAVPIVTLWGPDGIMIYNDAYAVFAGGRHPALFGSKVREGWPEVADFNDNVMKVCLGGHTLAYRDQELTLYRNGVPEPVWMNLDYSPILGESGAPAGVMAVVIETTAKVRAERALRASEVQFRTVAQAMPHHVWTAAPDGMLDWFNERVYDYSGALEGQLDGEDWVRLIYPDDVPEAAARWAEALATGTIYEVEFRIRRADGAYRWHIARALPIREAGGAILRWVGTNTDIHDRKLAETETSRDRHRLWNLSQDLMLVCDFAGVVTAVNPSASRMLGWAEDDMIGHNLAEFLHPDDFASTAAEVAKLSHGVPTLAFENRYRSRAGTYRLIDWTAVPDAGRIHAIGRDITEERALTRERDRIWSLSPVLKLVGRSNGDILAVNPSWTNILGWSTEETVGRNVMDFIDPDDQSAAAVGLGSFGTGAAPIDNQHDFITRDGGRRRIAWTTVPESGTLYGFGRDVTAEVEAARALAASTAERERIWNSTNDLMGTAGIDGYLRSVNPAWKRLLGYEDYEILSKPFLDIIDPDDRPKVVEAVRRLTAGEPVADFEDHLIHKDGRRSLIAWSAEPFGETFYIVGRNVTEQRAAEEALRQSQKMEAVGQLTGGLAHDFNNLLTGISGSLEMMRSRITQGRVHELDRYVTAAQGASKRAAALTHRLLAFSRRQTLDPKPTNVNRLIAGMEDLIRRTVGPGIHLEVVGAVGLWPALVDPPQLESALLNLCINGRDAMPDGGRLTIETGNRWLDSRTARERELTPGQYLSLCVSDTGTGMSPGVVARAFDPFFTTKPIGLGTGLGLSMIYGFAKQSGGQVRIYSEIGQGTMVCIYLPRHQGSGDDEAPYKQEVSSSRLGQGETVLIVDDEPTIRMLVVEILEELGYLAIEASDGATGLKVLQSAVRVDLLVTDVGLPGGMNGRQVADAGRALRPELKVLFITGYAENAVVGNGHLEPGMQVLTKPFAMDDLAGRIKELIVGGLPG